MSRRPRTSCRTPSSVPSRTPTPSQSSRMPQPAIFSTLRNRLIDIVRGESSRRKAGVVNLPRETFEEIAAAAGFDPQDKVLRGELALALETAMAALPPQQRDVILAQALDGSTFAELAEKTGTSIDTLMARKRRALRKLAAALEYWMED